MSINKIIKNNDFHYYAFLIPNIIYCTAYYIPFSHERRQLQLGDGFKLEYKDL